MIACYFTFYDPLIKYVFPQSLAFIIDVKITIAITMKLHGILSTNTILNHIFRVLCRNSCCAMNAPIQPPNTPYRRRVYSGILHDIGLIQLIRTEFFIIVVQ